MTKDERRRIYLRAIEKYGKEQQCMVAMEECAELIQAISKAIRYNEIGNLKEEIADVTIMIEQLRTIFGISIQNIDQIIRRKVFRLNSNIKSEME